MTSDTERGIVTNCDCQCSILIAQESTPLLGPKRRRGSDIRTKLNYFASFVLFLILAVGISVGAYLLIKDYEWEPDEPIPLLTDNVNFSIAENNGTAPHVCKIILIEIPGSPCIGYQECFQEIKDNTSYIQENDINFLIDNDGVSYQHIGFDNLCINCDNRIMVAISSNRSDVESVRQRTHQIEEIVDIGAKYDKLLPCCKVLATDEQKTVTDLATTVQNVINSKYNCTV